MLPVLNPTVSSYSTPASSAMSSMQPTPTPSGPSTAAGSPFVAAQAAHAVQEGDLALAPLPESAVADQAEQNAELNAVPVDPTAQPTDPNAQPAPEKRKPATRRVRWVNEEVGYVLVSAEELKILKKKFEPWVPEGGFYFFSLPAELRIQILQHHLCVGRTIDLESDNYRRLAPRLSLLQVSRRMHDEASQIFYGQNTFRLFPTEGRFFHSKKVLLARISQRYREMITSIEWRLGPGWTNPPKGYQLTPNIGMPGCINFRLLKIHVQIDPSQPVFKGFRRSGDWFTHWCTDMLMDLVEQAPALKAVQFDGDSGVEKSGELMSALVRAVRSHELMIGYGKERGWANEPDVVQDAGEQELVQQLEDLSFKASL